MEIVPMSVSGTGTSHSVGLPFNRRNVEEWSRLDSITGMMEKAKIETDGWSASNSVGKHHFAKMVDSRERNLPDGSLQQKQRKQMEMFQTMVPGGSMQVIRTQTVTSSSSSSWNKDKAFGELQLPVNSLDFSSEKSKGSVGRSGSISARRPPSRPRSLISHTFSNLSAECHRMHEEAKARMFGSFTNGHVADDDDPGGVEITEIDSSSESSSQKTNLNRQKSCSNEDINEESSSIQRSSKFRRSLQIPRTTVADDIPDWTNGKSLKERAAEIEQLLRSGSVSSFDKVKEVEKNEILPTQQKTKNAFVSAETLQEVRTRLRKSSNSDADAKDDGIVPDSVCVKDILTEFEGKIGCKGVIVNGTGSLSCRNNKSALSNSDWIRRRRSYGFEKVDSEMFGQSNGESSTDSGLGNSTESKITSPFRRFFNEPLSEAEAAFTRKSPLPIRERSSLRCNRNPWLSQLRGTKLGDRDWSNGTPDPELSDSPSSPISVNEGKSFDFDSNQKKQKKVEFCKTEVHFAAEPGRFHIVETDGKPPSTAVQRRSRRRTAGRSSPPYNPLGLPEVKFGDSMVEKELLGSTSVEKIDNLSKRIESELKELSKIVVETLPKKETPATTTPTLPKLYDVNEEDTGDFQRPRSILKNFRNSFHAGDSADSSPVWKSTVVLKNKLFDEVKSGDQVKSYSSDGESELKIRFRNLRKMEDRTVKPEPVTVEIKRRSFPDEVLLSGTNRILTTIGLDQPEDKPVLSVAERIKQAEQQAKNYSTKIDFRLGEVTVLQNGATQEKAHEVSDLPSWPQFCKRDTTAISCSDPKSVSNPSVKRLPSKDINTTTTRISINIPCESNSQLTSNKNKPTRSWSFGAGSQRCEKPQSSTLVLKTLQDSRVLKQAKPVHEMISKFDSLSRPVKSREQRRKTMPINYKAPKEYTHADLEEELRNFTDNLDKDFKDIYEEEIGSLKGSCRDLKNLFEQVCESSMPNKSERYKTLPLANGIRKKLTNGCASNVSKLKKGITSKPPVRSMHPSAVNGYSSITPTCTAKGSVLDSVRERNARHATSGRVEESGDDSDLLADEEVRSYMSAGHGGSDTDDPDYSSKHKKKSFERIRLQFKRLELRDSIHRKDTSSNVSSAPIKPTFVEVTRAPVSEPYYAAPPKVASISLRYEDDPTFHLPLSNAKDQTDRWEKTSNSSSTMSDSKSRERVSYLKGPSLSEKFSKTNSSIDNLFEGSALQRVKEIQENLRNSFRSSRSSRFREVIKEDVPQNNGIELTLEELSQAADDMVVAANGLTDDSMLSTSEDEESNRKVLKKGKVGNLVTISEGRKAVVSDTKKVVREKSLSSRATRLLQRASNREAAIAQRSSSEDIPAMEPVKKKLVRRPRPAATKLEKDDSVKICTRARVRPSEESKKETSFVHRERSKTVSSAAKEVYKSSTRSSQQLSERAERTKPSERRELLSKADAIAEQSVKSKRSAISSLTAPNGRSDSTRDILTKRRTKVNLRKVEATRVSQAV